MSETVLTAEQVQKLRAEIAQFVPVDIIGPAASEWTGLCDSHEAWRERAEQAEAQIVELTAERDNWKYLADHSRQKLSRILTGR